MGGSLWVLERYSEMDSVLENMNQLIQEDETWSNTLFARITYNKQRLAYLYHAGDVREVNLLLDETLNLINHIDWSALDLIKNQEVVGSWEQLNSSNNSQRDILIAMNNLACILTDIEKVEESVGLFRRLQDSGYTLNGYAFSKYVCSVWKSEGVEAVREALSVNKSFEIAELIKHSAMLSEIED
jgi:hypothetical protein